MKCKLWRVSFLQRGIADDRRDAGGGWQMQFNYLLGNQYKEPLFAQKIAFWPKIIAPLFCSMCTIQYTLYIDCSSLIHTTRPALSYHHHTPDHTRNHFLRPGAKLVPSLPWLRRMFQTRYRPSTTSRTRVHRYYRVTTTLKGFGRWRQLLLGWVRRRLGTSW